ncbi:hypothetical protein D3C80_1532650 [compost metagenome]
MPNGFSGLQGVVAGHDLFEVATDFYRMVGFGDVLAVVSDLFDPVLPRDDGVGPANGQAVVVADFVYSALANADRLVPGNIFPAVLANRNGLVTFDALGTVVTDLRSFVVLYDVVLVPFCVNEYFLPTQFVLETQLVEAITLVSLALDGHAGLVLGQVVRW